MLRLDAMFHASVAALTGSLVVAESSTSLAQQPEALHLNNIAAATKVAVQIRQQHFNTRGGFKQGVRLSSRSPSTTTTVATPPQAASIKSHYASGYINADLQTATDQAKVILPSQRLVMLSSVGVEGSFGGKSSSAVSGSFWGWHKQAKSEPQSVTMAFSQPLYTNLGNVSNSH